jgi:acyl-CoA reductase-like NAD-dependent aldehyde dehydrogenase
VHAIAAGCAVIMKPAPETRAVAAALVDHLRTAGVPDGLVQLACTPDDEVGRHLITHDDVDKVMLTGSYDTAAMFLEWKPVLRINAARPSAMPDRSAPRQVWGSSRHRSTTTLPSTAGSRMP